MKKKQNIILENGEHIDVVGPWTLAWRRFKANRIAMAGLIIFLVILVSVILVPIILGIDVNDYDLSSTNLAPSAQHLLGTDKQGRDVFFRLFLGGRISIFVGVLAAAFTVILGSIVGGVAGFYGGRIDNLLMRFTEVVYSLPFIPMILAVYFIMFLVPQEKKIKLVKI